MSSLYKRRSQTGSAPNVGLPGNSGVRPAVSTATPPPPTRSGVPDNSTCPRCGGRLINPESLGLCQGCGYLRTLEEKVDTAEISGVVTIPAASPLSKPETIIPAPKSKLNLADLWHVAKCSPSWLWGLLTGVAVISVGSLVADRFLPDDSFPRALWATLQVVLGVVVAIGTQFYAVLRVSANDPNVGGQHIFIFSGRLWTLVFRQLPATRWLIWLEAWSINAAAFAVLGIGGFGYWWQFYHPHEVVSQELADAAATWKPGENKKDPKGAGFQPPVVKPPTGNSADSRATMQVAIIGYVPDEENKPQSLIMVRLVDGKWISAGVVRRGLLPEQAHDLRDRLGDLVQFSPQIPGMSVYKAVWVRPELFCTVHHSGTTEAGDLVDPSFKELLSNALR